MPTLTIIEAEIPAKDKATELKLRQLSMDLKVLQAAGIGVERCTAGSAAEPNDYPLVLVDQRVVGVGVIPTRQQLAAWLGLPALGGCGGITCTCAGG